MTSIRSAILLTGIAFSAQAQTPDVPPPPHQHQHAAVAAPGAMVDDVRQAVSFPAELKAHTLTNMRDHLLALQEIQNALAQQAFDHAAAVAEQRLGMSSLGLHGAHGQRHAPERQPAGHRGR